VSLGTRAIAAFALTNEVKTLSSQLEERDAICSGGASEIETYVTGRDGDTGIQKVGSRKCLYHRRRHGTPSASVSLSQFGHRPRKLTH
jgi:hypothetical protein